MYKKFNTFCTTSSLRCHHLYKLCKRKELHKLFEGKTSELQDLRNGLTSAEYCFKTAFSVTLKKASSRQSTFPIITPKLLFLMAKGLYFSIKVGASVNWGTVNSLTSKIKYYRVLCPQTYRWGQDIQEWLKDHYKSHWSDKQVSIQADIVLVWTFIFQRGIVKSYYFILPGWL